MHVFDDSNMGKGKKSFRKKQKTGNDDQDEVSVDHPFMVELSQIKEEHQKKKSSLNPPPQTKIDDYYFHDPNIYDEDNLEYDFRVKGKDSDDESVSCHDESDELVDSSSSSSSGKKAYNNHSNYQLSVGEVIVTENGDEEGTGSEVVVLDGLKALPKSIRKRFIREKIRKKKNNFVKPDVSVISVEDENEDNLDGRCKICFWALSGHLARDADSLYNMVCKKTKIGMMPNNNQMAGVCEAGITFLSTFKMKYDEMIPWGGKHEVCNFLAKLWNNKISSEKTKFLSKMKEKKHAQTIDDFFKILSDSVDVIKRDDMDDYLENENEDELLEETHKDILKFLPPLISVDDVIYHFDNCIETDQTNQHREQLVELRSVQKHMFKKMIFIKKKPVTINGSESNGKPKRTIDYTAFYAYLTSLKVSREIASELRANIREERSGFLFNNLGLLRNHIPNLDTAKTINALKYGNGAKKIKGPTDQYKTGNTQGI